MYKIPELQIYEGKADTKKSNRQMQYSKNK